MAPSVECNNNVSDSTVDWNLLILGHRRLTDHRTQTREHGPQELKEHCMKVCKYNLEPVCVRPKRSFMFEAGLDPLDWVYIFKNEENSKENIPQHWQYVGCGLSDIYRYSQLRYFLEHLKKHYPDQVIQTQPMRDWFPGGRLNGFGFELTIRVKCNGNKEWNLSPPEWPIQVLQDLASYVFLSKNVIGVGDHVAWRAPLDGESSKIEHILFTMDPQLGELVTDRGSINFIQVVGVCDQELQAARQWNVRGILDIMREREDTGGSLLVTDMRRGQTIFELNPSKYHFVCDAIKQAGSDMVSICARHKISYRSPAGIVDVDENPSNTSEHTSRDESRPMSRMSVGSESALVSNCLGQSKEIYHDNICIRLSKKSAEVLPVMLNGRLAHKRHFTFLSFDGNSTITFIPEGNQIQSMVSQENPFVTSASWLQIYVPTTLREQMYESIKEDFDYRSGEPVNLPKIYSWPQFNLHLTIVDEIAED